MVTSTMSATPALEVEIRDVETVDEAYFKSPAWLKRGIDHTVIVLLTLCGKVKFIGYDAFFYSHCEDLKLKSLILGSSVKSIGRRAFSDCIGLASLVIPDSVKTIDRGAFSGCEGLTSLTLGSSVVFIGDGAFDKCVGLASLVIPDSVKTIDVGAFSRCVGLTSLTLGSSVVFIGDGAFSFCFGLTSLVIPDSVKTIGEDAFLGCMDLTSLILGSSVKSIGRRAFSDCKGLTSLVIPDSVKTIGDEAFCECIGLASLVIPNSVRSIGGDAFCGTSLTSVVVPVGCEFSEFGEFGTGKRPSFPPGCKVTIAPAATSATSTAAEEDNEEEEEPMRQIYWDLLDKATALRQVGYTWTIRTPDGDDILPTKYIDLIDQMFPDEFIDKCFKANDFVDVPQPSDAAGITKLKVEIVGNGGKKKYTGLKNDTVVDLEPKFVKKHFKQWFIDKCANKDNKGTFVHVPIGAAEDRPIPSGASLGAASELGFPSQGGFDSCSKPVKYRDVGKKGLCAPYGLASVLDGIGARDNTGADLGARIFKDAKRIAQACGDKKTIKEARKKGLGGNDTNAVTACVDVMREAGWPVAPSLTPLSRDYSVTKDVSVNPTLVQLTEGHCVTTIKDEDGSWVADSNEENWLPLSHKTLSRCMGAGQIYKSGGAIRAHEFAPGKKARKFTKRARGDTDQPASKKQKV